MLESESIWSVVLWPGRKPYLSFRCDSIISRCLFSRHLAM